MSVPLALRRVVTAIAVAATSLTGVVLAATPASAACADVEVVFARGTLELPGVGLAGGPFADAIKANLLGKSVNVYAVNYDADVLQTSAGAGATDMTNHVKSVAASCPNTSFVLGGYSQGASVTDIALGIPTFLGSGSSIPLELSPRIKAIGVFGNPLRLFGQNINSASLLYGGRAKDICASGDPICANGVNIAAHLGYGLDGSAASAGQFAANLVKS